MRFSTFDNFYDSRRDKIRPLPNEVHWELTYRCNLRCPHCYCQGLENQSQELGLPEIKKLLKKMRREGIFWLTLTGGEPLLRKDFLDIYTYAREDGFLVSIFSNGTFWDSRVICALKKSPPYSIEITINGVTKKIYEAVTGTASFFEAVNKNIVLLLKSGLPVMVKSNLLKPNQNEVHRIKQWAQKYLGKPRAKHFFKYDPLVYPRLNGDKAPLKFRLSFEEIEAVVAKDPDMQRQYEVELRKDFPALEKSADYLYQCFSWQDRLCVNPSGIARFCLFTDKLSFDLNKEPLKEGFGRIFSSIHNKKFKTSSRCRHCALRPICAWCPAKAWLETGCEEKSIPAYCHYTKKLAQATLECRNEKNILS